VSTQKFEFDPSEITGFAQWAIRQMAELYKLGDKDSGYLTARSLEDGRVLLVAQINECPAEKFASRFRNSMEKGERLFGHPDHVSSWQSRDVEKENEADKKWGGAIKAKIAGLIVSFSGLPEKADEALCVAIARRFGWLNQDEVKAIFRASNNENGPSAIVITAG